MNTGTWHMQFTVVDTETLRGAQKQPEKYPDPLVRVAEYSAFFVGLPACLQDDVIDRTVRAMWGSGFNLSGEAGHGPGIGRAV